MRSEDIARQVTFQAPGVEIEVMVIDDTTRRIIGQLIPGAEMTVELHGGDRVLTTRSDSLGRFGFDEVLPGPVRLTDPRRQTTSRWSTPTGCCSDLIRIRGFPAIEGLRGTGRIPDAETSDAGQAVMSARATTVRQLRVVAVVPRSRLLSASISLERAWPLGSLT